MKNDLKTQSKWKTQLSIAINFKNYVKDFNIDLTERLTNTWEFCKDNK